MFGGLSRLASSMKMDDTIHERGQAIVLFAFAMVGICGLVGMSADIGQLVYTRTDMQKAADAAALAGSQDLPSAANATTSATGYARNNGATAVDVTFGSSNTTITVKATKHVNYTFLRVLGMSGNDVSAKATAQASKQPITGYNWNNVAPFVVWGGKQQKPVNADKGCPFHTCVGKSYVFWSNAWMKDSGTPIAPDWTASNSNNFKGDINHGAGAPVSQIGDIFSDGGNGSVETPAAGAIIVVPLVDRAANGSNLRTFHVAAWLVIQVDPGCTKGGNQPCTGKVLSPATTTPPAGYVTDGSVPPPAGLTYTGGDSKLIE